MAERSRATGYVKGSQTRVANGAVALAYTAETQERIARLLEIGNLLSN